MHPDAAALLPAARCRRTGKFWEMHDSLCETRLFTTGGYAGTAKDLGLSEAKFSSCLASDRYTEEIKQSAAEAHKMGITGTPAFFIGTVDDKDGTIRNIKGIKGAAPYDVFDSAIADALALANVNQ
jgi:protein-disulfide isomerase